MRDNSVTTPTPVPPCMGPRSPEADPRPPHSYPSSKCDKFSRAVSHAILIGMDDDEAATVPDLAARLGIPVDQVQACMEATRERLSNLIATIPPTGPTSVRNRTGNGP